MQDSPMFFSPSWVHEPTFKLSLPHLPQKLTVLVHSSNEWRSILRSITANITPLHKEFQGVLVNPPPVVTVAAPTIPFPSDNERQLLMNQEILHNPHLNFCPASSIPRNEPASSSTLHVAQPQTTHLVPTHEDHTSLSSQQEETTHADHTSLPAEQEATTSTDHTSPLLPPVSKHLSMAEKLGHLHSSLLAQETERHLNIDPKVLLPPPASLIPPKPTQSQPIQKKQPATDKHPHRLPPPMPPSKSTDLSFFSTRPSSSSRRNLVESMAAPTDGQDASGSNTRKSGVSTILEKTVQHETDKEDQLEDDQPARMAVDLVRPLKLKDRIGKLPHHKEREILARER